jgi:hypothetical protein
MYFFLGPGKKVPGIFFKDSKACLLSHLCAWRSGVLDAVRKGESFFGLIAIFVLNLSASASNRKEGR